MISSLLFGTEGSYHFFDIPVNFIESDKPIFSFVDPSYSLPMRILGSMAHTTLESSTFRFLSTGYLHTFVHEMGHAMAIKVLTDSTPSIKIESNRCMGWTTLPDDATPIEDSIIDLAGPLANMIFSAGKITAAAALSHYSMPSAILLGASGATWMIGELFYASSSLMQEDGDLAEIAERDSVHLLFASSALVGTAALGIFQASALL